MNTKFKFAAACVVAMAAVSAQAQVAGTGLYVGGSIGHTKWKGGDGPLGGIDSSNTGGKVYGGYEFTPNAALELGYADLGKFKFNGGSYKASGPYLDAVGKFPFAPGWSGLARAGLFQGKLERELPLGTDDENGTGYKVGLGVQYDLTQNASVRTEYERYRLKAFSSKPDTDLLSVGLNYKF